MDETDREVIARVIEDLSAPSLPLVVQTAINKVRAMLSERFVGRPVDASTRHQIQGLVGSILEDYTPLISPYYLDVRLDEDDHTRVIIEICKLGPFSNWSSDVDTDR